MITVGNYVIYDNGSFGPIDPVIGIVIEVDEKRDGVLVEWSDGFVGWYFGPKLIKV